MKRAVMILSMMLLLAISAHAQSFAEMNYVRGITCSGETGMPELAIELDARAGLDGRSVRYSAGGNYILVTLPNTYVNPSRRLFSFDNESVGSVLVAQRNRSTTNIKIELEPGVRIDPYAIRDRLQGSRLVITFPTSGAIAAGAARILGNAGTERTQAQAPEEAAADREAETLAVNLQEEVRRSFDEELARTFARAPVREEALTEDAPDSPDGSRADEGPEPTDGLLAALFADDAEEPARQEEQEVPSLGWSGLKMVSSLCVVVGIILLISYALKRFKIGARGFGFGGGLIRVIGTHSLGLKRSIMVVDVGGEVLVLSVAGNEVRMLTKIEDSQAVERIRRSAGSEAGTIGFLEHLRNARPRGGDPEVPPAQAIDFQSSIDVVRQRIANLKRL